METTFGDCYTRLPPEKTGPGSRLMKEFETCKKAFDGTNLDKTLELNFPLLGTELRKAKRKSEAYEFGENHVLLTGYIQFRIPHENTLTAPDMTSHACSNLCWTARSL